MSLFNGMFDPSIRIAMGDPREDWPLALPGEEIRLHHAVLKRRREFRAGRSLARTAMRELGMEPTEILAGEDRAPIWPTGLIGSISHCDDLCAVAIGRIADGFLSIGLDLEPAEALDTDLVADICTAEECSWLASQPQSERGLLTRLIFSAKECAYKCQYALSRQLLDFHAMAIRINREDESFVARFKIDAQPFLTGAELVGRFRISETHIVTAMVLKRDDQSYI